ncbi:hypothetical protein Lser_V15G18036 [Lactuca serriola]
MDRMNNVSDPRRFFCIRLNCSSSYNADFDGDEMNVHLPQDEISRSKAYNIVNANNQYIVPARGDTVRGLIEDHIVSSVLLTMQDTFLNNEQFNQLLYASGVFNGGNSRHGKNSSIDKGCFVKPVLPAVWKPKPLWTGKQVITALLNHLTRGYMPCIVHNKSHARLFKLCIVVLVEVNRRLIIKNLMKYGLLINSKFWFSSRSLRDWLLLMCCLTLPIFPLTAYIVEKLAWQKRISDPVIITFHILITTTAILYPIFMILRFDSVVLSGVSLMLWPNINAMNN